MKLIYLDESGTFNDHLTASEAKINKRKSLYFVLSAFIVDLENWEQVFGRFKTLRADIRRNYGVNKSEQLHAHEIVSGSGVWRHEKYKHLTSPKRRRLLKYMHDCYAEWPEISVTTAVVSKLTNFPSIRPDTARDIAIENLFNRIDKSLGDEPYIAIVDGQEDQEVIKILRKMRAYNNIRTRTGFTLDVRIKSLVEDPMFKHSKNSYFLRAIDHIAYGTLHVFDERLNPMVGKDLLTSSIYQSRGMRAAHTPTANRLPGVIIVPKLNDKEINQVLKESLGSSPDSSGGAGDTR